MSRGCAIAAGYRRPSNCPEGGGVRNHLLRSSVRAARAPPLGVAPHSSAPPYVGTKEEVT